MKVTKTLTISLQSTLEEIKVTDYLKTKHRDNQKETYKERLKIELLLKIYGEDVSELHIHKSLFLKRAIKAITNLLTYLLDSSEDALRFDTDLLVPYKNYTIIVANIPFIDMRNKRVYLLQDSMTLRNDNLYKDPKKFYNIIKQKLSDYEIYTFKIKGQKYEITKR